MTSASRIQPISRCQAAAGLLVLAAVGHALAIPHHADPGHGGPVQVAAFAAVAAAQLLGAAAIARRPAERGRRAVVVAGSVALIAVWAVSRTTGLAYGPHPGEAEAIGALDALTVVAQLGVVGLLMTPGRRHRLPMAVAACVAALVLGAAAIDISNVDTPAHASTPHHTEPEASRPQPAEPAPADSHDSEHDGGPDSSHHDTTEHTHP